MSDSERQEEQWKAAYGRLVERAWADEGFKRRLIASPREVLAEGGMEVRPEVEVRVTPDDRRAEGTDDLMYFYLPSGPDEAEMTEAELAGVAGGGGRTYPRHVPSQYPPPQKYNKVYVEN